jgi:hypothetical protein
MKMAPNLGLVATVTAPNDWKNAWSNRANRFSRRSTKVERFLRSSLVRSEHPYGRPDKCPGFIFYKPDIPQEPPLSGWELDNQKHAHLPSSYA